MALNLGPQLNTNRILMSLEKVENSFKCQKCGNLPIGKVFRSESCAHNVCEACKTFDSCPVADCQNLLMNSELKQDFALPRMIDTLVKMRNLLNFNVGDDEVESRSEATNVLPSGRKALGSKNRTPVGFNPQMPKPSDQGAGKAIGKGTPKQAGARKDLKDLNKKNKNGETPLHVACIKGDIEKVREFLTGGAEPNTQDNNGWTPLHEAVQNKHDIIARLLLEHGANPNVPGGDDNLTPLHEAVQSHLLPLVKVLILKGASKSLKDSGGKTPVDYAYTPEMKRMLDETRCELTDSEQLNQSMRCQNQQLQRILITSSQDLTFIQVEKLKTLVQKMKNHETKCDLTNSLSEKTTHFIVPQNPEKFAPENAQYYEALMAGKWILTLDWIDECHKSNSFVDEEEFLVVGTRSHPTHAPEKSRVNEVKKFPRLLKGFNFYLEGTFGHPYPSKDEIEKILRSGGANVLKRVPNPESIPEKENTVGFHARPDSSLAKCSHIIVYQEGPKEPDLKYNMKHIKSLPAAWLFETINNYDVIDESLFQ